MAETLDDNEVDYMIELVEKEALDETMPDEINIEKLAQILVPSDDINDDLTNKANEIIKREEAERKRKEAEEEELAKLLPEEDE